MHCPKIDCHEGYRARDVSKDDDVKDVVYALRLTTLQK